MIDRIRRQDEGEELNAILFVADEYAQVADKCHQEMWRVSREANIAPLLAYQVHTDLQGAIGREAADGMLQNFATRIVWGTSDPASIALVSGGKAEVLRDKVGVSDGTKDGWTNRKSDGTTFGNQFGGNSGTSDGQSGGSSAGTSRNTSLNDAA